MVESGDVPIRVLHVDDQPEFVDLAATYLERVSDPLAVVTETDPDAVLDRLDAEPIDCVVSDYDMPGTNGLALLEQVRERRPDLPFILFTAKGSEEIASEAISAGVTEYLEKETGTDQYTVLANRIERAVAEHRAKAALGEHERRLSTLLSNLPGMVYRCRNERGWPMEFVSEGAERLTGYTPAELESGTVDWGEDILADEHREEMWDEVQTALREREPFEVTYRITTADGRRRWLWERGRGVYENETGRSEWAGTDHDWGVSVRGVADDDSERGSASHRESPGEGIDGLVAIEGFITDATPREQREREDATAHRRYRSMVESAPDPILVVESESGRVVDANKAAADLLGRSRADVIGERYETLYLDGEAPASIAAAELDGAETELVAADGERVPVRTTADGLELDGVPLVQIHVRERTDRGRRFEQYRTLVENVGDPMYVLDEEGRIEMVNEAMATELGYDRMEMVGRHHSEFVHEDDAERGTELLQELRGHEREWATYEVRTVASDGETRFAEVKLTPLTEGGQFRGSVGVFRDISDRKRREEHLEQFASVVSHDLKSPLNVAAGRIELARETGDTEQLADALDAIEEMNGLVDSLLTLARRGQAVGATDPVPIASAVERAIERVETNDTTVTVADDRTVEADPDRLCDLLENLFGNAVDHGGADRIRIGALPEGGFYVADDGDGIPSEEREAVFENGYTTDNGGCGLGLAIVERIARGHGWTVSITDSEFDDGSYPGARFEFVT